jgi:Ribonuclease G/E
MSRTLFLRVSPGEVWAALAEKGALEGLRVLRAAAAGTGGLFLGRIVALRPELPAALIEIGLERPGFLDARDADPRRGLTGLTEGAVLIVELIKEPRGGKAAGLRALRSDEPRPASAEKAASDANPPARL